jgi:hypothetical protein
VSAVRVGVSSSGNVQPRHLEHLSSRRTAQHLEEKGVGTEASSIYDADSGADRPNRRRSTTGEASKLYASARAP